ncbi:GlxA family transcriptional regulator [Halomonas binhaiensis]|uniref:GlxA family transcriptional regulator n=1 Tax=Halomonas binhaiensis TaxID=2562282 RepID=A0A5C1NFV2_9GAMM|nr:GlxA family transcriptional regulator [Halomonas binhaiensis]QEM81097.1 GlxA family transcriptional regulator [Halomonas binhaiensis]
MPPPPLRRVAIVAYPNCQVLDVSGPWQVFASANQMANRLLYDLSLVARAAGMIKTNGGLTLCADQDWQGLEAQGAPDTLLVAGGSGVFNQCRQRFHVDGLRRMAPHVRRLGAICSGAFLLAEAGLLNGRKATTHWRHCTDLAQHYPDIEVLPDALYVEDRGCFTSAGVTAGIDLALSLVEADHGTELASRVARELVMFLHRPGGQSQFSEALLHQQRAGPRLRPLIEELHATPGKDHDIHSMAERLAITPRHLSRLFRRQLDTSPGEYLTQLRLEAARSDLLGGEPSLERLASRWRLGGAEQLRRLFQRHYGVSPSVYRARFAASPPNTDSGAL